MWMEAELIAKSYKPIRLEPGMLFINKLHHGTRKEEIELFALDRVPQDEEAFIQQNGYPVQLYIIDDEENVLAYPDQIAWWDEGEHSDDLSDITLKEINNIINNYGGTVDIDVDFYQRSSDDDGDYPEEIGANIFMDKVILRYVQEEEEECYPCEECKGTGEGTHEDSVCWFCDGEGQICPDTRDDGSEPLYEHDT